jgi:hypothetical protein
MTWLELLDYFACFILVSRCWDFFWGWPLRETKSGLYKASFRSTWLKGAPPNSKADVLQILNQCGIVST